MNGFVRLGVEEGPEFVVLEAGDRDADVDGPEEDLAVLTAVALAEAAARFIAAKAAFVRALRPSETNGEGEGVALSCGVEEDGEEELEVGSFLHRCCAGNRCSAQNC